MSADQKKGAVRTHIHRKAYVITFDLSNKVRKFKGISLEGQSMKVPEPNHPFFQEVKAGLIEQIEKLTPADVQVDSVDTADLAANILALAKDFDHKSLLQNGYLVSSCVEFGELAHDHSCSLEVNRLVDYSGKPLGIGPRPRAKDLGRQVREIIRSSEDRDIVLIEDGSFSGGTLCKIISMFEQERKAVKAIVVGILFPKAKERLRQSYKGELIVADVFQSHLVDWMPDHDFFPFVQNNGKVLGMQLADKAYPIYDHYANFYSVPYLSHFLGHEDMGEWTGLGSASDKDLYNFSHYCVEKTIGLFELLESLNGGTHITIEMLQGMSKVAVPFLLGSSNFLDRRDTRVLDYLTDIAHD